MRFLLTSAIVVLVARATTYVMRPNIDAEAIIIVDGTMRPALVKKLANDITLQTRALAAMYPNTGRQLRLGFALTTHEQGSKCGWYANLTDTESMITSMNKIVSAHSSLSTDIRNRRTFNAVIEAADSMFSPRPQTGSDVVRRAIVYLSDRSAAFEYVNYIQQCLRIQASASFFRDYMQDQRIGFIYSLVDDNDTSRRVSDQTREMQKTGLTDLFLDGNMYSYGGVDTFDYYLSIMLSPEYIATTSTTLPPRQCLSQCQAQCQTTCGV